MFAEQGVFELVFLAAVALIVVGPKDLPVLMRKVGKFTAKMRGLAAEFRASFDEMARQSELDELRKEVEALRQGVQAPNLHQMLGTAPVKHDLEQQFDELQHGLTPPPVVAISDARVVGADEVHAVHPVFGGAENAGVDLADSADSLSVSAPGVRDVVTSTDAQVHSMHPVSGGMPEEAAGVWTTDAPEERVHRVHSVHSVSNTTDAPQRADSRA